jgi:hypothetical protein
MQNILPPTRAKTMSDAAKRREILLELQKHSPALTLDEMGQRVGLTRERVRQILKANGITVRRPLVPCNGSEVCGRYVSVYSETGFCYICLRRIDKFATHIPPVKQADTHGTRSCYALRECRCKACCAATLIYSRKSRLERMKHSGDAPHGTASAYLNWGCRCAPCKAAGSANNRACKERRLARKAGTAHA